jgi:cytochrome c oxidase assembly protein subunit 15
MRLGFRHLAATTTGFTFALILIGVYTGAIGAGLSCEARWPLCDGWMGLFPATWPSFVEWFHRLVAMVTGFMILGTAIQAWRGGYSRKIRLASTTAVVVLPVQILLGANTVLYFGALATVAHHAAAQTIFGALLATTAWAFQAAGVTSPTETESETEETAASGSSGPVRL